MDAEKITQELERRFAAPLKEFYQRRIIFWYDEEREFEDQLDGIRLDGARIVALTGSNTFAVKKLLCEDDLRSNFLVYDPRSISKDDDNWLINVQLYSEEFRADLNSIWMDEMGLDPTPIVRAQVKRYRKFFGKPANRNAVKKLNGSIATAAQMHLAVMAALCGCGGIRPAGIVKAVLEAGLDPETNEIYQRFVTYGADKPFWAMVAQATGYQDGDKPSLGRLAVHLLLTAATRTMHPDLLAGLEPFLSSPHQAWCYDFVSDQLHSEDNSRFYEIARFVEREARLPQRFGRLTVEDLVDTECFPCVNECILVALMKEISDYIIQVDSIKACVQKRRAMAWYDKVACYYDGLLQVANMQAFYLEHSAGFHMVEPQRIWKAYTTNYYRMDTFYRQFHLCFQRGLKRSEPLLDDLFKHVADKVEGLYAHWYLGLLGENWSDACADELALNGAIQDIPQQQSFYLDHVKYRSSRVFVIISDALRYEVAASLSERLQREMQCKVKLDSCEGIFPTATKFGMAALLPHRKLELVQRSNGELAVQADGMSTDSGMREKVLKAAEPSAIALRYDSIIGLKRAERAALVRGSEVVYIYHDKIDEVSHVSDDGVFQACEDAIDEIKNLIRIIVNEFGGTNIIVTADHGFLYTYSPLNEDSKVDKTTPGDQDVEVDRRYLITQKGATPMYLMPVRLFDEDAPYDAFTPRENVRIKKKGGGLNFVHGGISLQEMVVPVLEFQFLRNAYKQYQLNKDKIDTKPVPISLLSASRKISNMIFALSFYQKEAVGGNREQATYLVYFTDESGQKISDTNKIIADKTSENAQERTFRCNFSLRSQSYSNQKPYYLVIADESGLQPPEKLEFQIDIAFAFDEFNFLE